MSNVKQSFIENDEPIKNNCDFWKWFASRQKDFHQAVKERDNIERDFFNILSLKLNELKEGFFFLAGMPAESTAELILTAYGVPKNISFVEELVEQAPTIEGWKFTALNPPVNTEGFFIQLEGYKFDEETLSFYAEDSPDFPDEINLSIVHREWNKKHRKEVTAGVHLFLDNYLGEIDAATKIDHISVIRKSEAKKELIPISKLKAFLDWREKEFIEKYEGSRYDAENTEYSMIEGYSKGNKYAAAINTTLLDWDGKVSHPWFSTLLIRYNGQPNGMPNPEDNEAINKIEDSLLEALKAQDGCLHLGRKTSDGERAIYFVCKDFRKPSRVFFETQKKFADVFEIEYDIYKDKYWQSFTRPDER